MKGLGSIYLVIYNLVELFGWAGVFVLGMQHVFQALMMAGSLPTGMSLYSAMGWPLYVFQMLMLLDVVHAAIRLVKSPLFTAVMQIASRLIVVNILYFFPLSRTTVLGLMMLLCAWCPTEIIRYTFYSLKEVFGEQAIPRWLVWLRYSTFTFLYPIGISGELIVLWTSLPQIKADPIWMPLAYFIYGVFTIYPFGSVILYRYMLKQRRSTLYGDSKKKSK